MLSFTDIFATNETKYTRIYFENLFLVIFARLKVKKEFKKYTTTRPQIKLTAFETRDTKPRLKKKKYKEISVAKAMQPTAKNFIKLLNIFSIFNFKGKNLLMLKT